MLFTLALTTYFTLALAAPAQMTINTPANVIECQPVQLTWVGGTPPYYLSLVPGNQPFAPQLRRFPSQSGTSYTWIADLPANTDFNLMLRDSTGAEAYSALVTEQAGGDTSCEKPAGAADGQASPGSGGNPESFRSPAIAAAAAGATAPSAGTSLAAAASMHLTAVMSGATPAPMSAKAAVSGVPAAGGGVNATANRPMSNTAVRAARLSADPYLALLVGLVGLMVL